MNEDELAIRSVVESWAVSRDSDDWGPLRATWHDDGQMRTTWSSGSADDFVASARRASEAGVMVHHFLGGSRIDIRGRRAIAQTKMTISQRTTLDGVEVDVTCTGRFYDFFEQRDGTWRIVLREPIYEKDRLDPVTPGWSPRMDHARLAELPAGCRHLLYCQQSAGMTIRTDVPGLRGPEVSELLSDGAKWLDGLALTR